MRAHLDCQSCLLDQVLQTARSCAASPAVQEKILRESLTFLSTADWRRSPMELSAELRAIISLETGVADPFIAIKRRSTREALRHVEPLRARIAASVDPLEVALAASIAGNVLDYGSRERFDLDETLATISARPFAVDDRRALVAELTRAESIGLIADNAGEIVFDGLLLETIFERLGPRRVVFAVRREPFINDALVDDARESGLRELPGVELMTMNPRVPAEGEVDWPTWQGLLGCDVILSKGQGNYEAFSAVPGVFFLLMTKCAFVAQDLSERVGRPVSLGEMVLWRSRPSPSP